MTTGARTRERHRYLPSRRALTSVLRELAGHQKVGRSFRAGLSVPAESTRSTRIPLNHSPAMLKYATVVLLLVSGTLASKVSQLSGTCETLPSTVHITKGKPLNETASPLVSMKLHAQRNTPRAGSCRGRARVTSAWPSARARARRKCSRRWCIPPDFSRYAPIGARRFTGTHARALAAIGAQECMCCRESFLREKTVTLSHCYDSSGTRLAGRNASLDVKLREPADCKCFRCGDLSE